MKRHFDQAHACPGYSARITIEWSAPPDADIDLSWRGERAEAIAEDVLAFAGPKTREMVQAMRGFTPASAKGEGGQ